MAIEIKIGERYGHWTVIGEAENFIKLPKQCLCRCDCGKEKYVSIYHLVHGESTNCGCIVAKNKGEWNRIHKRTHGGTAGNKERLYNVYRGMLKRCYLKSNKMYKNYGGRGISVCDEWQGEHGYENFREWAYASGYDAEAPKHVCTIDRIDVNGNYEPSNCRWISAKEQGNNRRDNHLLTFNDETHTVTEWAEILGMKPVTLHQRLRKGWTVERALTQPIRVW